MNAYRALVALIALLLALPAASVAGQGGPSFAVQAGQGGAVRVQTGALLEDGGLRGALESGLPLRFHLRVELWRKGFFDRLSGAGEIDLALVQDPLDGGYVVDDGRRERRFPALEAAVESLQRALAPTLRPTRAGRYYYLATLEVETLSLSDLDELRRWLRGEVQPAVEGRSSPTRAVERGLGRLFVRVIGLPSRKYEDRSATFIFP